MTERPTNKSLRSLRRSPLWAALDAEIVSIERTIARVWQGLSIGFILLAVGVSAFVAPEMGKAFAVAAGLALAWFTVLRRILEQGRSAKIVGYVGPVIEISFPSIALIVIAQTQGAGYALASWVPPVLFALILFVAVVRLKPALPIIMGLAGAIEYFIVYTLVLRAAAEGHIDPTIASPSMQLVRALSIVMLGFMGTFATLTLRRTVGLAARRSRAEDLFGKYRLGKQIASGGMGTVHEALYCPEGGFERKVAIKRVHPHLAKDPEAVQSFRREAELCAHLAHPNIVAVFDFGITEDTYFFAMELVEGMDLLRLRQRCATAAISIPTRLVAAIGREIAEGLAFAHEVALDSEGRHLNVVHRDLNPSNVLVSRLGQVKVADFGIARALRGSEQYETTTLTGKVPYFAPEQARGEAADHRVDLYALGLVLWELLCLRAAFKRESDSATLLAVLHTSAPPPSSVRPELAGSPWDAFCEKALARDPAQRFQSARDMSAALGKLLELEGSPRPDELAEFLRSVEATTGGSLPEVSVTTLASETETVRESPPEGS